MDACDSERRRRGLSLQDVSESSGESCRPRKGLPVTAILFFIQQNIHKPKKSGFEAKRAPTDQGGKARMDACAASGDADLSLQDVSESSGGFNFCAEFTKVKNSCCLNRGVTL